MSGVNKIRILIIDDDVHIREMLSLLFEAEGVVDVQTAANGADGIKKLKSFSEPYVVYLDLMMPVCNGWDVLRQIENDPTLKRHKIAVMSASRPDVATLGGNEFLPKPLELGEVLGFAGLKF